MARGASGVNEMNVAQQHKNMVNNCKNRFYEFFIAHEIIQLHGGKLLKWKINPAKTMV